MPLVRDYRSASTSRLMLLAGLYCLEGGAQMFDTVQDGLLDFAAHGSVNSVALLLAMEVPEHLIVAAIENGRG